VQRAVQRVFVEQVVRHHRWRDDTRTSARDASVGRVVAGVMPCRVVQRVSTADVMHSAMIRAQLQSGRRSNDDGGGGGGGLCRRQRRRHALLMDVSEGLGETRH
jgi:hypothetical protein